MIKILNKAITLTRGDSLILNISIKDGNEDYAPQPSDVIRFAMSKKYKDDFGYNLLITKIIPNDTLRLELLPEDTEKIPYGTYNYDIEITHSDGKVDTFISSTFTLTGEVE